MGDSIAGLISGGIIMADLVAGLYFLRFWKETGDRLFVIFAAAFWILAVQRSLLSVMAGDERAHVFLYGIRLLAFLLIIAAILDKNRTARADG